MSDPHDVLQRMFEGRDGRWADRRVTSVGDDRTTVDTAERALDALPERAELPDPSAMIASLEGAGIDALVEAVATAERFARMAMAWRDETLAAAHEAGVRCREAELRAVASPSEARQWAEREMTAEFATAVTVAEQTLASQIAVTRQLTHAFPVLAGAYRDGEVAAGHVRVMIDVFIRCDEETKAAADVEFAGRAARLTPGKLRTAARRWKAKAIGVEEARAAARAAVADRHVEFFAADDHLMWLSALLPAVQAQAIHDRLTELAKSAEGGQEQRTRGQLRADVMCALLLDDDAGDAARHGGHGVGVGRGAADDGEDRDDFTAMVLGQSIGEGQSLGEGMLPPDWVRGIRPTVVLTVPVMSLMGHHDLPGAGPAVLEGHGPIDVETARQLAAQAPSFIRVLTHPHTGAVLGVDQDAYAPPADLRKALVVRDGTCRFPGCARRAGRCEVDHTIDYARGGCTDIDNLAHLCKKHHTGWKVRQLGGGVLEWTSPAGRVHLSEPATHIWPPPPEPVLPPPDTGPLPKTMRPRGAPPGSAPASAPPDAPAPDPWGHLGDPPF